MTLNELLKYFTSDPLRVLTLVGGGGGLMYWYDRFKNRTRLKITIADIGLSPQSGSGKSCMEFEVENLGLLPNSIDPVVTLSGITPKCVPGSTGKRHGYIYNINDINRNLPPNKPMRFRAYTDADDSMAFIWFIRVRFNTTRGGGVTIFVRSFSNERLSRLAYVYERIIKYGIFKDLKI